MRCPACGSTRLGHHSSYRKYLYEQPITILRLRCRGCGRTHAVIPSWSLPDTSVGTAEVERYLMARERGVSRSVALEEPRRRGMHAGYGKQLERRLGVIVSRGKSLWPQAADRQLGGLAWIRAVCTPRPTATPLLSLNHFSLEVPFLGRERHLRQYLFVHQVISQHQTTRVALFVIRLTTSPRKRPRALSGVSANEVCDRVLYPTLYSLCHVYRVPGPVIAVVPI